MIDRLAKLNIDYEAVVGRRFHHFFCPVLFCDEETKLCQAHVINAAFRNSARRWTIQRKDVDNFYGSFFESDFVTIQERGKHNPIEVLTDKELTRKLRPRFVVDGKPVEHYVPEGAVPAEHSQIIVGEGESERRFVLKLPPEETMSALDGNWEIQIEKDVRIAALPSLLKAAHLTLFEMLGYEYGLSLGGRFIGYDILGRFFLENRKNSKAAVLKNAYTYFSEYANMVRPIMSAPPDFEGTTSDRLLFLCMSGRRAWAFLILLKTGALLHAVLAPVFDEAENSARYLRFLENPPATVEARLSRFAEDRWELSPNIHKFVWPDANFH